LNGLENSQIDWGQYQTAKPVTLKAAKSLHPHQINALDATVKGLASADRGKLIMACGKGNSSSFLVNHCAFSSSSALIENLPFGLLTTFLNLRVP
jgi:predicted helicase